MAKRGRPKKKQSLLDKWYADWKEDKDTKIIKRKRYRKVDSAITTGGMKRKTRKAYKTKKRGKKVKVMRESIGWGIYESY